MCFKSLLMGLGGEPGSTQSLAGLSLHSSVAFQNQKKEWVMEPTTQFPVSKNTEIPLP